MKRSSIYLLRYGPPRISYEDRLKRSGLTALENIRYNPSFKIISGKEAPQLARFFVLAPNKATRE